MSSRQVVEGVQVQGVDEQIAYRLTTTPWGSDPTEVEVAVWLGSEDVTADVTSGEAWVVGDAITLPTILNLTANRRYRVEVRFTAGGSVFEAWFTVVGER